MYITKENGKMNYQVTSWEALSLLILVCVIQTPKSENCLFLYGDNVCLLLRVKNSMDSFLSLMLNVRFISTEHIDWTVHMK